MNASRRNEGRNESRKGQRTLSVATCVLGITACALMWTGASMCTFVKFASTDDDETASLEFGIWRYLHVSESSCDGYPDDDDDVYVYVYVDPSWKAARAFSILSLIFGTFLVVYTIAKSALLFSRKMQLSCGGCDAFIYLLVGIFQGLTLLMLDSGVCKDNALVRELNRRPDDGSGSGSDSDTLIFKNVCEVSTGAKLAMSAAFFYFFASFAALQWQIERDRELHYFSDDIDEEPLLAEEDPTTVSTDPR